jgi:hypothetical protein
MIGSCTDDTNLNSVAWIPASISVKDVNATASIEVIDGTFTIDFPDCVWHGFVDWTPPDVFCGGWLIDNSLVWMLVANWEEIP